MPNPPDRSETSAIGVWTFYIVFAGMLVGEGLLVDGILVGTRALGLPALGPWIAWLVFVLGGFGLGLLELRTISPGQQVRDPILRACCWLQRRLGTLGFVINAGLIGGAPGAAVALRHVGHQRSRSLVLVAAGLFASIWVPLFVFVWR